MTTLDESPARRPGGLRLTAGTLEAAAVATAACIMLAHGWRRWADGIVDFGREVSIGWRLSEGEWLYRDVASFNGPFSAYCNAAWFTLGGANLRTLIIANLVVAAAFMLLMRHLLIRCGARWGAGAALVVFALVFLSGHLLFAGNYNWVMPYAHELTHGLTLSAGALACFLLWVERGSWCWILLTGFLCGTVFLTKVEVFAALATAFIGGFICPDNPRSRWTGAAVLLLVGFGSVAAAAAVLTVGMPPGDAVAGTLGGWRFLGDSALWDMPFFERVSGLDEPANHARAALISAGWLLAIVGCAALAIRLAEAWRAIHLIIAGTFVWLVPVTLVLIPGPFAWLEVGRSLPIVVAALAGASIWSAFVARATNADAAVDRTTRIARVVLALWALALLARLGLHARVYHYGFALAAPAAMVVVAALVDGVPCWVTRVRLSKTMLRLTMIAAVAVACVRLAQISIGHFRQSTLTFGAGANRLYVNEQAAVDALAALDRIGPIESLLVVPEGAMLNVLRGVPNTTPYSTLMPPEVRMFGEARILESLGDNPPHVVLVIPRGLSEYGVDGFGAGYAEAIAAFLESEYDLIPLDEDSSGMRIYRRRDNGGDGDASRESLSQK